MSFPLHIDQLGIVIRVRHGRPVPFDLTVFPRWLDAFTDPETAFAVESKAVTTRVQDFAFGYEMGIDLFGFGKVELKPDNTLMDCKGARSASDLEILKKVLGQFRGALERASLTTQTQKVEFSINAHCKPEGGTKDDVLGLFTTRDHADIITGVSLGLLDDGARSLEASIQKSLVDKEQVFVQMRIEGPMEFLDSFLVEEFPFGFFEPLKAFGLHVKSPP